MPSDLPMMPETPFNPLPPFNPSPDDAARRLSANHPSRVGEFAPPDVLTRDALRDAPGPFDRGAGGPALDFDYARTAVPLPPAPSPRPFDPMAVVRDRPWVAVGIATAIGVGLGLVLFGRPKRPPAGEKPVDAEGHGASLFDTLVSGIGEELMTVGKQAVDELTTAVKDKAQGVVGNLENLVGGMTGGADTPPTTPTV
jgi:hypothetical protein